MKTVTIRRCPGELRRLIMAADKENQDVVLRLANGSEILLSLVDDFDYELAAQRRNPKFMAFLDERTREARKHKGIPLDEVARRLGLPHKPTKSGRHKPKPFAMKRIEVSPRSQVVASLLEQAGREDVIAKISGGFECFLSAVCNGDLSANNHRSEKVIAYLDELGDQGKLPPLEVVFVDQLPSSTLGGKKPPRRKVPATGSTNKKVRAS